MTNLESQERDCSRWAKKFDKVAHIYAPKKTGEFGGGTVCGSVAHCLGNNYAVRGMATCPECIKLQKSSK